MCGIAAQTELMALTVDLATPEGSPAAVTAALERFGAIDILVNNVGIAPHRAGFLTVSDQEWTALIELNSPAWCAAVAPRSRTC
jgi:NAD(P)-dependent dehydrogenase (short-subunit alcohol dehydrogenase family)